MICQTCGTDCRLFRQIFADGTEHVTERCPICGTLADKKRPFLPNDAVENISALPIWGIATVRVIANQPELPGLKPVKPQPVYYKLFGG